MALSHEIPKPQPKPVLRRWLMLLGTLLLAGYAAICLLLYLNQRNMIYFPQPRYFSFADDFFLPGESGPIRVSAKVRRQGLSARASH